MINKSEIFHKNVKMKKKCENGNCYISLLGTKVSIFCHFPVFSAMQLHLLSKLGSFCI